MRKKLLLFSLACAFIGFLLGAGVFYIAKVYLPLRDLVETNVKTIAAIHCDQETCDASGIDNDWEFSPSDYVVDKQARFFLNADGPAADLRGFVLHHSDAAFLTGFRSPASFQTPSGESWRLLSTTTEVGPRRLGVMVGYAERAPWKMNAPVRSMAPIDSQLQDLLRKVVGLIRDTGGQLELPSAAMKKITVDGYEVVDLSNNEIVSGGYWLPAYLPKDVALPPLGTSFRAKKSELYLVRIDDTDRLLSASAESLGNVWSIAALLCLLFLAAGVIAYVSGKTFLRKYFVFSQSRPPEVEKAIALGEGPNVEFKRSISAENPNLEQILETVAAFANTDDGTLFIGVDDNAKIKGLKLDPKQKDQLAQKIHQLIRQRIKPAPWIQVDFPEVRGLTLCRVFVPRGEEPLHFLEGAVYVRYGPTDVKAEPQIVKRLLAAHAF